MKDDTMDLLFSIGAAFDLAREQANELAQLRIDHERLRRDYAELVNCADGKALAERMIEEEVNRHLFAVLSDEKERT